MNEFIKTVGFQTKISEQDMNSALFILVIIACIVLFLLAIFIIYLIVLIRRSNIVAKKVDYLVEDITYKTESLNIFIEAVNKLSNYLLTFDAISKRSLSSLIKLITENKNYFYYFFDKMKKSQTSNDKDKDDKKNDKSTKGKSTSTNKKGTNKK